jgi:hypothetical protein
MIEARSKPSALRLARSDNRWVIAAVALIGLLAAYLPANTDRKEFWTLDGPLDWRRPLYGR